MNTADIIGGYIAAFAIGAVLSAAWFQPKGERIGIAQCEARHDRVNKEMHELGMCDYFVKGIERYSCSTAQRAAE